MKIQRNAESLGENKIHGLCPILPLTVAEIHSVVLADENMTSLLAQANVSFVSACSVNFWPHVGVT